MAATTLTYYVIYDHPSDYPEWWVTRCYTVPTAFGADPVPTGAPLLSPTLAVARHQVPEGRLRVLRQPEDDRVIVESWW